MPTARSPQRALATHVLAMLLLGASVGHAQSSIEWASPIDGDFGSACNWSPTAVPGPGDTARLGDAGAYTVRVGTRSVRLLHLANPEASLAIEPGELLTISGTYGPGTIVVNADQSADNAGLELQGTSPISARVTLNSSPDIRSFGDAYLLGSRSAAIPIISSSGVVGGRGRIFYAWRNSGTIEAVGPSGYIQFSGATITQGPSGVIRARDRGVIDMASSGGGPIITGGTLDGGVGGVPAIFNGFGTIADAIFTGLWAIPSGNSVQLAGVAGGDGTIVVNESARVDDSRLELAGGALVGLRIELNASPSSPTLSEASVVWTGLGEPPTLLPLGVIAGRGQIRTGLNVRGTISPGLRVGDVSHIAAPASLRLEPASRVEIDVAGPLPTEHDRLSGSGIHLGGTLRVRFADGYTPSAGDRFTIITASNLVDAFAIIDIDPIPAIGPAHVVYTGDAVVLVPCAADRDGDGELTIFDFLEYQNQFDAGDRKADLDGDGRLTLFDFLAFQNRFDAGCG